MLRKVSRSPYAVKTYWHCAHHAHTCMIVQHVGCVDGIADKKQVIYTRNYLKINAVQTSVQTVQTNV